MLLINLKSFICVSFALFSLSWLIICAFIGTIGFIVFSCMSINYLSKNATEHEINDVGGIFVGTIKAGCVGAFLSVTLFHVILFSIIKVISVFCIDCVKFVLDDIGLYWDYIRIDWH